MLFKSVKGLWSDLGVSLSAEEIEEDQRETWMNFPRGHFQMSQVAVDTSAYVLFFCQSPSCDADEPLNIEKGRLPFLWILAVQRTRHDQ
jgi:hypothetical protein